MIRAGVGGGEGREATEGGEGRGIGEGERGLMAAEGSASRGEGEAKEWTRMRPSSAILWSLCLFQHDRQIRLLMETSNSASSCRVKSSAEGST